MKISEAKGKDLMKEQLCQNFQISMGGYHNALCDEPTMQFRNLKECMSHVLQLISKMKHLEIEQNREVEDYNKKTNVMQLVKRSQGGDDELLDESLMRRLEEDQER